MLVRVDIREAGWDVLARCCEEDRWMEEKAAKKKRCGGGKGNRGAVGNLVSGCFHDDADSALRMDEESEIMSHNQQIIRVKLSHDD